MGERGIDDLSITHARHRKGLDPAFAQQKEKRKNQTNLAKYLNNDHIHGQIFWTKKLQNKHTVLEQKAKKDIDAFKKGRKLVAKELKTHFIVLEKQSQSFERKSIV